MPKKQPGPTVFPPAPTPPTLQGGLRADQQANPGLGVAAQHVGVPVAPSGVDGPKLSPAANQPVLTAPAQKPTQVVTRRPK